MRSAKVHAEPEVMIVMSREESAPQRRLSVHTFRRFTNRCERIIFEIRAVEIDMQ